VTIIAPPTSSSAGDAAQARHPPPRRPDRGLQIAGMADHVGVGVIHHDQVVARLDRLDELVGHLAALISGCRS
jgi:predicted nucleic acid-binding protein